MNMLKIFATPINYIILIFNYKNMMQFYGIYYK